MKENCNKNREVVTDHLASLCNNVFILNMTFEGSVHLCLIYTI